MSVHRVNLKEVSSYAELETLRDLIAAYLRKYKGSFHIKAIAFNDTIPKMVVIDDFNNYYYMMEFHGEDLLVRMNNEEKKGFLWEG